MLKKLHFKNNLCLLNWHVTGDALKNKLKILGGGAILRILSTGTWKAYM